MRLSVVIPVHNGGEDLRLCMAALAASTRVPDEIWVVDDASNDNSDETARAMGAQVLSLRDASTERQAHGPAVARNRGAKKASGDVLLFFDADVVVHRDTIERIEKCFSAEAELAALFGSYDANPQARNAVSLYKNLLHHHVHQHSRCEAWTFWTGCGAIRRDVFFDIGGFDESYAQPSIEDIEMGRRLRREGHRIRLCPDVQVTHLKRWTLRSMMRTDIVARAVPWTRLLLQEKSGLPDDLNLDWKSRLSGACAWSAVGFLLVSRRSPKNGLGCLASLGIVALCNKRLLRFFQRRGGTSFAFQAFGLHILYFLYSSLIFVSLSLADKVFSRKSGT